jgi:aryl-alcohol dehydrogenase-like predicted oxidoreductase
VWLCVVDHQELTARVADGQLLAAQFQHPDLRIPGTSSVAHLRENLIGAALELPADATADLDAIGR